jgi:hypothetical protein
MYLFFTLCLRGCKDDKRAKADTKCLCAHDALPWLRFGKSATAVLVLLIDAEKVWTVHQRRRGRAAVAADITFILIILV